MTNFVIGAQMYSVRDRCTNYEDMLACMKELKAEGFDVDTDATTLQEAKQEILKALGRC